MFNNYPKGTLFTFPTFGAPDLRVSLKTGGSLVMENTNTSKTWKRKTKSVGLTALLGLATAGAGIVATAAPAAAHEFCDAETTFTFDDDGEIAQATTLYTSLSVLGVSENAEDGLCQARPVVSCQNSDGAIITIFGNWTNGNSSVQASQCPASFPMISSASHQTAYDGQIFPA